MLPQLITATIPPSIGLILYGYVSDVSIGRLFLAGVIPGLLMMLVLMATTYLIARRRGYVVADATRPTVGALASAAWAAKWALLFPVALLFAIRGGVFTPSEVGAFAVVYALARHTVLKRGFDVVLSRTERRVAYGLAATVGAANWAYLLVTGAAT